VIRSPRFDSIGAATICSVNDTWEHRMGFAALALAIVGFAVGTMFRIRVLLPILLVLLLASIVFSVVRDFSILEAALMVFLAQTIVQGGYFLGLIAHAVLVAVDREPRVRRRPPRF
jgi:ABC-type iron transport system FetAB permease component